MTNENEIQLYEDIQPMDIQKMAERVKILDELYRKLLQKDTDYGTIPGTPKPTLYKSGAELLQIFFHLRTESEVISTIEDPNKPFFLYRVRTRVYNWKNELIGTGLGEANTGETRYASRKNKTTGKIEATSPGDVFTLANTVLKMAEKRSFVDGILRVTGASRIFTQDLEDMEPEKPKPEPKKDTPPEGITDKQRTAILQYGLNDNEKEDYITFFLEKIRKEIPDLTRKEASELIGHLTSSWDQSKTDFEFQRWRESHLKQ
ncbi:MAG: hypothetical protein QXU18_11280 [Thermoplasmatales archaeon]